jgi:hypothetical protein
MVGSKQDAPDTTEIRGLFRSKTISDALNHPSNYGLRQGFGIEWQESAQVQAAALG